MRSEGLFDEVDGLSLRARREDDGLGGSKRVYGKAQCCVACEGHETNRGSFSWTKKTERKIVSLADMYVGTT